MALNGLGVVSNGRTVTRYKADVAQADPKTGFDPKADWGAARRAQELHEGIKHEGIKRHMDEPA